MTIITAAVPTDRVTGQKFRDPHVTARGERRAKVALRALDTLWFNTGTLCNLTCASCYIESSPRNDRLAYLSRADVRSYLNEIVRDRLPTRLVGFTGGEPFMNPDLLWMLQDALARGLKAIVLTNAMKPMRKVETGLLSLNERYGPRLTIRVSVDHYASAVHEAERGKNTWQPTIDGLAWLARHGFEVHVAGRMLSGETEAELRRGYVTLFEDLRIRIDASDPVRLMIFPSMDPGREVPEITEACWSILGRSPESLMCSNSRMVVRRKGSPAPAVVACTLLPYDPAFELGTTLAAANGPVPLNHHHCAAFCVLGGAACSR